VGDNRQVPPLLVLDDATVVKGPRRVLGGISAGLHEGDAIGVVGRNGSGKSTLLRGLAGGEHLDGGRVTRRGGTSLELVSQSDALPAGAVRHVVFGDRAEHEWAGDARVRDILTGLFGAVAAPELPQGLDTPTAALSGGQARRVALAAALVHAPDVLLLDEPTNHLDLTGVTWLAGHLRQRPAGGALVVVTHDRWFLDAVTTRTWEVVADRDGGRLEQYEGGYAAYVLARAERDRVAAATDARRRNLLRKELAWLRRGAPARTSKPKFRLDAAAELIADEPAPRDRLRLQRATTARLGKQVVALRDVTLCPALHAPPVLQDVTWRLGPGDRIGLLGRNGAGKTTLVRLLLGEDPPPFTGEVERGRTVVAGQLAQRVAEVDPQARVLPWLAEAGQRIQTADGDELTAGQLLEDFGFAGDAAWQRLAELSGGELRRLHVLRLLLSGANLLLLDEPTNDLDVQTLAVLEDVLDRWPGTLVVVSHDRYFLERVCDDVWLLPGDHTLRHLPGGVEEYLAEPAAVVAEPAAPAPSEPTAAASQRQRRKELARHERAMARAQERIDRLHEQMEAAATDPAQLAALGRELAAAQDELSDAEDAWLAAAEDA
jgi:ATP-binding cassette subfamily F protein uup